MAEGEKTPTSNYILLNLDQKVDKLIQEVSMVREAAATAAEQRKSMRHDLEDLKSWKSGLWRSALAVIVAGVAVGQFTIKLIDKLTGW